MRLALICLVPMIVFSSVSKAQNPYERVDSIMRAYDRKIKSQEDLWLLSYFIRTTFSEDSLRLRAAFIWITENIEYDIRAYETEDPKAAQIDYVLRKKKAVCSGYANLLKYFCDAYKIEGEVVSGRARGLNSDVYITNTRFNSNHAWNAVKINGQWRLIDATWAAGTVSEKDDEKPSLKPKYRKEFNEFYYFTPPERFALNHYPSDLRWSFVGKMPTYKDYVQAPLFTTEYTKGSLLEVSPSFSLLEAKVGDTLTFRFRAQYPVLNVQFVSKRRNAGYYCFTEAKGDWYEAKYPVLVSGFYDLALGFDSDRQVSVIYKLKAEAKQ